MNDVRRPVTLEHRRQCLPRGDISVWQLARSYCKIMSVGSASPLVPRLVPLAMPRIVDRIYALACALAPSAGAALDASDARGVRRR